MKTKDLAVGRGGDLLLFDPDKIVEAQGYNTRDMSSPETLAHIRAMVDSILDNGTASFPPITIKQVDGEVVVYAGHCRRRAFSIAKAEGAPIKGIPALITKQSVEELALDLLTSNNGLPLTPLEKAAVVKRLLTFSWTQADIARKLGMSQTYIGNLVALIGAPAAVKEMVAKGEVSATTAIQVVKEGEDKVKELTELVANGEKATNKKLKKPKKTFASGYAQGIVFALVEVATATSNYDMCHEILERSGADTSLADPVDLASLLVDVEG
jgi:ParB family transcriptional regulator, chromosome partitioning protein